MGAYMLRRLLATIPVMAVVAVFVFFLLRLAPGDPAAIIAGEDATAEAIAAVRAKLGLDRPVIEQFALWLYRPRSGRSRRLDLLQPAGHAADRPAHRADPSAHAVDPPRRGVPGDPDGRARGLEGARARRPPGDGVRGHGLRHADLPRRLRPDLHLLGQARLAAGPGLPADRARVLALRRDADPALARARHRLHGAHRPHHPRLDARGAVGGLHPHRELEGPRPPDACSCCTR